MELREEIQVIRRELRGVERNVAQLTLRLDVVEARQQSKARNLPSQGAESPTDLEIAEKIAPVEPPTAKVVMPPPLPAAPLESKKPAAKTDPATQERIAQVEKAFVPDAKPVPKGAPPKIKKSRRFGPPEGMSFEMALGSYWAPRLGMLLVAIGTVWGFTYVAQQFHDAVWMPYARVGLGYALALGLLGVGRTLESKYTNYARILMGGGLGLLYFVTFATWYIPATRIAPSQEFTLGLLGLLVLGWGALAQWRKSQPIALTMTLLGHFTVALSTLSLESPSRAAVGGLLVLGIGSAFFLIRNGWYLVAYSAMVGSYLNQFFWLSRSPGSELPADFTVGMLILVAYLVTYAVAEFLTPPEGRTVAPRVRTLFVGLNTTGFVVLSLGLVQAFPFARPYDHLLYFGTALFTLGFGVLYTLRDKTDRVGVTYFTKTSVLIAIGLATWLDGTTLTLSLALESLVLIMTARYRREHSGRILGLGAAILALLHGGFVWADGMLPAWGAAGFGGEAAIAVSIVVIFGVLTEAYRVTPWHTFPAPGFPKMPALNTWCRVMEMLPEGEGATPQPSRMTCSHLLSLMGTALAVGYVHALVPVLYQPTTLFVMALGAIGVALWRASAPLLTTTPFLVAVGAFWWLGLDAVTTTWLNGSWRVFCLSALPLLAVSELMRHFVPTRLATFARHDDIQGSWQRNALLLAHGMALTAGVVFGVYLQRFGSTDTVVMYTGVLALLATAYAAGVGAANVGLFTMAILVISMPSAMVYDHAYFNFWQSAAGIVLMALAAAGCESRVLGSRPGLAFQRLLPAPYVLYGVVTWWAFWFLVTQSPVRVALLLLMVVAVGQAALTRWFHKGSLAVYGTLMCTATLYYWLQADSTIQAHSAWSMTFGVLVMGALIMERIFDWTKPFAKAVPGAVLLVVAWVACYHFNDVIGDGAQRTVGLVLMAFGFLAYGGIFRRGTAVALSLVTAALATGPLFFGAYDGATVSTVAVAFGSVMAYWLVAERGATLVLKRTGLELLPGHAPVLTGVLTALPALLGIVGLSNVDAIHDFYLTISWTVWALVLFAWALFTHQSWFRYVALGTIGLAISRAFLVDVWQLSGGYRVAAMIFLGLALLGVAFGYTRWRASQETGEGDGTGETGGTRGTE